MHSMLIHTARRGRASAAWSRRSQTEGRGGGEASCPRQNQRTGKGCHYGSCTPNPPGLRVTVFHAAKLIFKAFPHSSVFLCNKNLWLQLVPSLSPSSFPLSSFFSGGRTSSSCGGTQEASRGCKERGRGRSSGSSQKESCTVSQTVTLCILLLYVFMLKSHDLATWVTWLSYHESHDLAAMSYMT